MASIQVKGPDGKGLPTTRIPIVETNVRATQIVLEDGSRLRMMLNVEEVFRCDHPAVRDAEGRPQYLVASTNTLLIEEVPAHLVTAKNGES